MRRFTLLIAVLGSAAGSVTNALEVPFEARRVIDDLGDNPRTAIVFDVDSDGDNDLIGATLADNTFAWYENDGEEEPGFTKHILSSSAGGAREVWAADINSDGRLDILGAARADNAVYWYRNEGGSPPTFTEFTITDNVLSSWSVYAADVDGDGDLDVTSAGRDDDRISWHENDGSDPPVWTKHVVDTDARRAQKAFAADVDGDGDTDLLSASGAGDEIAWYENDGASPPSFTKHSLTTSANNAKWVWAADLDRDGDTDILAAAETEATIEWFENDGAPDPTFTRRVIASVAGAKACIPWDVDHDGDLDVLSNGIGLDRISIHENLGGSPLQWNTYVVTTESDNPLTAFPGDIDGDGRDDIVAASFEDDTIGWYRNDWVHPGPVLDQTRFITRTDAMHDSFALGDVNDDGTVDLVLSASTTGEVEWLQVGEDGVPALAPVAMLISPAEVAVADIDHDGDPDVLVADANGTLYVGTSDGAPMPAFVTAAAATGLGSLTGVAAGDLDRDGDTDVVVTAHTGEVTALLNDGSVPPSFVVAALDAAAPGARDPEIFDINADGVPDVLIAASDLDRVIVYQGNGDDPPTFERRVMADDIPGPWDIEVVDLNNDGREDIAVALVDGFVLHMLLNEGGPDANLSGFGWSAANLVAIDAGDAEFDGLNDVVGFSLADDTFRIAENFGGENPFLFITSLPVAQLGVRDLEYEDFDQDGLPDIVYIVPDARGTAVSWIPNRGGQSKVSAMSIANPEALIGRVEPMLAVSVANLGNRYDDGVTLVETRVRLLDAGGAPLTVEQAQGVISAIRVYADVNLTSTFERLGDEIVFESAVNALEADGEFAITIDPSLNEFDIPPSTTWIYFIAIELTESAASAKTNQIIVEFPEAQTGDVMQSSYSVPVRLADSDGASTPVVTATIPSPGQILFGAPWIRHTIDNTLLGAEGPRGADVNGDGHTDYAIAWEQSHISMLYLHPGAAHAREPWPGVMVGHAANVETAVPHDLDGDGDFEVLSALSAGPRIIRAHFPPDDPADLLDASQWTTENFTQTPVDLWVNVEPVDIDGMNGADLVIGSIGREGDFNAQIGWLRCPEDPADTSAWTYHQLIEVEWALALVGADMDDDGDQDIVYSNRFGDAGERGVFWLENPGAGSPALTNHWPVHLVGSEGGEVGYLDFIRTKPDDLPQIAVPVRPRKTDIHTATDASGDTWTSERLPWPDDMGPTKAARFADIDMDGHLDLVLTAVEAREDEGLVGVAWLRNPGVPNGDWNAYDIAGIQGEKFDIVAIDDVDDDGDMDVLASEEPDNNPNVFGLGFVWYENPLIQDTGDVNRDRVTDTFDLAALLAEWGPAGLLSPADLNNDGEVDSLDLAIILAAWGQTWGLPPSE